MRPALPLLFGLVLGLAACGGGSSGPSFAGGGTSGTGITRGPVSGFSSVIVSGQRYRIGPDTKIRINDELTSQDARQALDVGLPVTVYWEDRTASANIGDDDAAAPPDESDPLAEEIVYDPTLIGPVTQVPGDRGAFEVLGVDVRVTPATLMIDQDGNGLDVVDPDAGTVLEVAGEHLTDGSVLATSIRIIGTTAAGYAGPYEVEGYVTEVEALGEPFTLKIGDLVIDYEGARGARGDFEGKVIVAQAGNFSGFSGITPERFFAEEIRLKERGFDLPPGQDREVTLIGYVSVRNPAQLIVAGQIIVLPPPERPPGLEVGDLVRVEGTYSSDAGVIIPDSFDWLGPTEIAIEDRLYSYDPVTGVLTTELGIQLVTNSGTVFRDDDDDRLEPSELIPGSSLRIVAATLGSDLYAVRVGVHDDGDGIHSCDITARVDEDSIASRSLTIFDGLEVRWAEPNDLVASVDRPLRDGALVDIEAEGPGCNDSLAPESRFGSIDAAQVTVLAEETFGEGEEDNGGDEGGENDDDDGGDDGDDEDDD